MEPLLEKIAKFVGRKAWAFLNTPLFNVKVWMAIAAGVAYFWSVIVAAVL